MKITEALKSLENSWSRENILIKIKNGEKSEKIVNDFFDKNNNEIETLINFINPEDQVLLKEIEYLTNCEAKLIKKIINKNFLSTDKKNQIKIPQSQQSTSRKFGSFMIKWSNKFVFITLLVISAIALTKQAWA